MKQVGRYELQDLLGEGGMGRVYRAYDPDLDRDVVLKIIKLPDMDDSRQWRERFKREVQAAARLNDHPHIVTIHDVGLEHDPPYVVMELLKGGTLKEKFGQAPLPWHEAMTLLRPLVAALAHAHQAGIVHRDVKPSNVMFTTIGSKQNNGSTDRLKLVDFGLARPQTEDAEQLTQTGSILGTPAYMSPEQAMGLEVDGRADIFAIGVILVEAITGNNPLAKSSLALTIREVTSNKPVDISQVSQNTPPQVTSLIQRMVARDPEQRYPSCEALLQDWDLCLNKHDTLTLTQRSIPRPTITDEPKPQQKWPIGKILVGLVGLIVVGGLGWAGMSYFAAEEAPPPPQSALIASIARLEPKPAPAVEVRRWNNTDLIPATFGMLLHEQDIVNTYANSVAGILCNNGNTFQLPENRNFTIACEDTDNEHFAGILSGSLTGQLLTSSEATTFTLEIESTRSQRSDIALIPLLLSPRNTFIRDSQPTFAWQAVEGASGYRLTVNSGASTWEIETEETQLTYPDDVPPLTPGSVNTIRVTTLDDETIVDVSLLRILDEATLMQLDESTNAITALELDDAAKGYLLAQLYQQHELWADTIDQLEQVTDQAAPDPNLTLQLADLYAEIGLYVLAEEHYQIVLIMAEQQNDKQTQAQALTGLGQIAATFAEPEQADQYLTTAETIYRDIEQNDLANIIVIERDKLTE